MKNISVKRMATLIEAGYSVSCGNEAGNWVAYLSEDDGNPCDEIWETADCPEDPTDEFFKSDEWRESLWRQCWKHSQQKFPFIALVRWNGSLTDHRIIYLGVRKRIEGRGDRPFYYEVADCIDTEGDPSGDQYSIVMDEFGADSPVMRPYDWHTIKAGWYDEGRSR